VALRGVDFLAPVVDFLDAVPGVDFGDFVVVPVWANAATANASIPMTAVFIINSAP
jgi:hypothetical protein